MTGVTHHDLALLWLERLRLQASLFDLRNNGVRRAEYRLDELFFELVQLSDPALFMEVGAHDGQRAVRAKAENPAARVVAMEANPHNHATFAAMHDFARSQVDYLHLAATDAQGEVTFNVMPDVHGTPAGNSSLLARRGGESGQAITVPAMPLDSFLPDRGRVALWLDVEGANEAVLGGARAMLERVDVLKIEVEEQAFWDGQWLASDVVASLLQYDLVPVARDRSHDDSQYNLLLVSQRIYRTRQFSAASTRFLEEAQVRELPGVIGRARRDHRVRELGRRIARR